MRKTSRVGHADRMPRGDVVLSRLGDFGVFGPRFRFALAEDPLGPIGTPFYTRKSTSRNRPMLVL
jgi:hypothetical protein